METGDLILGRGQLTDDLHERVTAHNGGNDHDQCHHQHDIRQVSDLGQCSNIVTLK